MTLSALLPEDEHDARLREEVAPRAWRNPEAGGRYHLVVIGAGTAGLVTAGAAASLGARVALVESDLLGGDCLNFGCVPSKALLRSARAVAEVRAAGALGLTGLEGVGVDFAAVLDRVRRLRADISPHDSVARFRSLGADVFLGRARFLDGTRIEVVGPAGDRILPFSRAVIATGASPALPPIPGLADSAPLTNATIFSLRRLPRRFAVLGAGPIGCELAQAMARLGSQVTVLAADFLPREEPEAAAVVRAALEREGVDLRIGATLERVERSDGEVVLTGGSASSPFTVKGDEWLVATGRRPNVDGLGLEKVGVEVGAGGVVVDDHLRTTNRRIWAAGDVCSRHQFTHAADAMARLVVQNALFFGRRRASLLTIPRCTYTSPEIAHVGLTEAEATAAGVATERVEVKFAEVDRAILDGATEGFARALVRRGSDRLVGVTIVGEQAGNLIGEATVAITHGLRLSQLSATVHPYPTEAEVLRKLGDTWRRGRLTPGVKGWFRRYFALRR